MNIENLIGRNEGLFTKDTLSFENTLFEKVSRGNFLIIGGAGTIGQAVTIEIVKRNPQKVHVVDISENNLVELVRNIRSSIGYIKGEFQTYCLDCGSINFETFFLRPTGQVDY